MFDDYLSKFPKPGSPEAIRQLKIAAVISVFVIAIFSFLLIYGKVKLNAAPEQTFQAEVVEKSERKDGMVEHDDCLFLKYPTEKKSTL